MAKKIGQTPSAPRLSAFYLVIVIFNNDTCKRKEVSLMRENAPPIYPQLRLENYKNYTERGNLT